MIVGNVLHLHPDPQAVVQEALRLCAEGGSVFLCWPIRGLDTTSLRRIERAAGRPLLSAWRAHLLRTLVGIFGAVTGGARPREVRVDEFGGAVMLDTVVADCQRVVVLRRAAPLDRASSSATIAVPRAGIS